MGPIGRLAKEPAPTCTPKVLCAPEPLNVIKKVKGRQKVLVASIHLPFVRCGTVKLSKANKMRVTFGLAIHLVVEIFVLVVGAGLASCCG